MSCPSCAAAEARIRGLEEQLRVVSDTLLRTRKKRPDGSVVGTTWPLREAELDQFFAALKVAEAALAPPPEAAKARAMTRNEADAVEEIEGAMFAACAHEWTTDGCHANVFCRKCYVNAPPEAAKRGEGE